MKAYGRGLNLIKVDDGALWRTTRSRLQTECRHSAPALERPLPPEADIRLSRRSCWRPICYLRHLLPLSARPGLCIEGFMGVSLAATSTPSRTTAVQTPAARSARLGADAVVAPH